MTYAREIAAFLEQRGAISVDPPVLQPAHLYLEMAGEDLRKRAFLVAEANGEDLCLRPDMTVPVCRYALAGSHWGQGASFALRYEGQVFRRRTDETSGSAEFVQAGAEWFFPRAEAPEAEIIAAAIETCRAAQVEPSLKFGDVGVFLALVDACALPPPWADKLKRGFARPGGAGAVLAEASAPAPTQASALGEALASLSDERAALAVEEALASARIALVGGRSAGEIASRLRQKALSTRPTALDGERFALIRAALAIEGEPGNALAQLTRLTRQPGMKITDFARAVERAAARWAEVQKLIGAGLHARFSLSLGRGLSYYDGFVFELEASCLGPRAALGGGGRYDGLLHALARHHHGAPDISGWGAAGFAVRPQRLWDARP